MKEQSSYIPPGYIPAPIADEGNIEEELSKYQQHLHSSGWSSGICACFDDMQSCCIGLCCPCILFGKNVEFLEGRPCTGPCLVHCFLWSVITGLCCSMTECFPLGFLCSLVPCYACSYRRAIREKYKLEEAPCGDLCTHVCCHMCALCQEYREIRERSDGFNLSVITAPPLQTMHSIAEN